MNRIQQAIAIALGAAASAFGQNPGSVTLEAALSGVAKHEAVRQARIVLDVKAQALAAETGWKGPQISLTPSTVYNDAGGDVKAAASSLGADLVFPTGLSAAERERKTAAAAAYALAEAELAEAYGKAYLDIFGAFSAAYAAQEAVVLAGKETELARLRLAGCLQLPWMYWKVVMQHMCVYCAPEQFLPIRWKRPGSLYMKSRRSPVDQ